MKTEYFVGDEVYVKTYEQFGYIVRKEFDDGYEYFIEMHNGECGWFAPEEITDAYS
jgi:hypothetical protein